MHPAFERQGNDDAIREIVFAMHFSGPIFNFDDADHRNFREHDDRRHARVDQLMLRRHGYIITWLDFEVLRRHTGYNGLLRESSGVAGTYPEGLHTTLDRFPYHRRIIPSALTNNLAGLPEGLALPSVRALLYYAEQLDKLRAKPAAELTAGERATINRLDDLIRVEYAWAIIHSWALERYWNKRVPVLHSRLIAWVEGVFMSHPTELQWPLPGMEWANAGRALVELARVSG